MTRLLTNEDTEWTRDICHHLFNEFREEFLTLSPYKTAEQLTGHYARDVAVSSADASIDSLDISQHHLPLCLVMYNSRQEWVAVAVLSEDDMGMLPHLTPWLSFLYVHPEHRQRGYSTKLLQAVSCLVD